MPILRNSPNSKKKKKKPEKKRDEVFFGKLGLEHPNLLRCNPTMRFHWNH